MAFNDKGEATHWGIRQSTGFGKQEDGATQQDREGNEHSIWWLLNSTTRK